MSRIGYVLKVFPRLSQTFVVNELRAHERAGQELVVFSLKRPRPEDADLVQPALRSPVIYLDGERASWPDELARQARAHRVAHLHAHFANVATSTARLAARQLGIPYSFTAHALDIFDQKVDRRELADKVRDAAAVVTVSQYNVRHLRAAFGRRPLLVYNGMPLDDLRFSAGARSGRLILAVGRLIEKKGFVTLLDACRELVRRGVDFRCQIIGGGPLEGALQAQIERLGLQPVVTLLGALPPDQVKRRLAAATLLAAPCVVARSGDRDGLPTVLLEAMALGTPCVSTDVTGIPEVVIDHETGLQVAQHNAQALADACQDLLQQPALAERLAGNARRLIEQRFDSRHTAQALRAIWAAPPRRVLFRVHNRRGMGHWMRSLNIAREILAQAPSTDVLLYTRSAPPFPLDESIRCLVADDPDRLSLKAPEITAFEAHVVVDDTILKDDSAPVRGRRVLIMRKLTEHKQQALFAGQVLRGMDCVVVPHTAQEFGYRLPDWLAPRTRFVGPIVRRASAEMVAALRAKFDLRERDFVLISTPGGGGFDEDAALFFEAARLTHQQLEMPNLRHILVRGPNATVATAAIDERMRVVDAEPDMVGLFALADAVISAGGYNSVNEIRLTQCPAFFLPGNRKYDDQHERVRELADRGLAWVIESRDAVEIATTIADTLRDPKALKGVTERYASECFETGNAHAAELILRCASR